MSDTKRDLYALSPTEAAHIAANVYFTLEGWEAHYQFKLSKGKDARGAPAPSPALAATDVIRRNVVGSGPVSLGKTGLKSGKIVKSFEASTGSNLLGRTRSGFGYLLQFERDFRKHIVIATRGTRPEMGYPDILTDANISISRGMRKIGPVHAGFYDVYESILPTLEAADSAIMAADFVHCVGHSLGGAVANLIALHFALKRKDVRLYTFGAPRVGMATTSYDKIASYYIGEHKIFRVSHNFDPIPMVPVAPYIHALPSIKDRNNIFIGSPVQAINMDNHGMENYIDSVKEKKWERVRADKLQQGYLDKQYFLGWRASENFLKRAIGIAINAQMAILHRILQGLIDTVGIGLTEIATVLDLLAIAIRKGIEIFKVSRDYVVKFIGDCARLFGLAVEMSAEILARLFKQMMAELTIAAKLALAKAGRIGKSKEFEILLTTAVVGSIGVLLM